mmetsp:Transcript_12230/g.17933  ORF Transcript_12230/g.17933 Transcript_12230/m.17933 type:complete len:272 (+) Transcript_12230:84-899(+)
MELFFYPAFVAILLVGTHGFSKAAPRKQQQLVKLNAESSTTTTAFLPEGETSRRSLLLSTAAAVAAAGTTTMFGNNIISLKQSATATPVVVRSIQEAIQIIDKSCDRRYLHAVVASNYRFFHGGNQQEEQKITIRRKDTPLLADSDHYSEAALKYFQQLEQVLQQDVIKPSNGQLAITTLEGGASIWPLRSNKEEVHYAWFQNGGIFFPRRSRSLDRRQLIVDGKDCGRDSLEDALGRKSCEVLIKAESFLVVPVQWEEELRQGLQSAFLV